MTPSLRLQLEKKTEQRDGIRTAGNGDADAISRAKKRLVVKSLGDGCEAPPAQGSGIWRHFSKSAYFVFSRASRLRGVEAES